jgi:hypothetical protein
VLYSREKLVEERGFVGGATRDIEIGRVGRRQGAQVLRDQGERSVPVDWNVVVGGGVIHHRVRHTPLYLQIKVVPVVEFGDRRAAKNSGGQRFEVASQATALAPFSQNSNDEVCLGSGHAQPGQSKPSGWFMRSSVALPLIGIPCSVRGLPVARSAPHPPAGLRYCRIAFFSDISRAPLDG